LERNELAGLRTAFSNTAPTRSWSRRGNHISVDDARKCTKRKNLANCANLRRAEYEYDSMSYAICNDAARHEVGAGI
jgi:hypothetical protein